LQVQITSCGIIQKPQLQLMQTAMTGTEMGSEMIMPKYETYEC